MLKIKDNVDLKELEKFGFNPHVIVGKVLYKFEEIIGFQVVWNIKIDEDRILHFNQLSVYSEIPSVIYDLIKADLVEKVEE